MENTLEKGESGAARRHILAIPFPLMGHMTPIVQLCNILIAEAGCRATIACCERDVPLLQRLLPEKYEENDNIAVLPVSDGLPLDIDTSNWETVRLGMQSLQEGLASSFAPHIQSFSDVACVISDIFLTWPPDVARQLGVPFLAIWVAAAAEYQVYFHAPALIKAGKLPFKAPVNSERGIDNMMPSFGGNPPVYHRIDGLCEEEEEIKIPGLPGLNRRDFPTFLQIEDSSDEIFCIYNAHIKTGLQASMLLFNSFEDLEGPVLATMRSEGIHAYPIGPLLLLEDAVLHSEHVSATEYEFGKGHQTQDGEKYPELVQWLDGQMPRSVIYVAFGTLLHLEKEQVRELALGLLYSRRPFIWVYPNAISCKDKVTELGGVPDLPEGFLAEVRGRGLVLEWAPQKLILNHPSIGAFLSHCGWNSTMETICFGVPTLGLPYFSDQFLHCKLMVEEWKFGLRMERSPDEGIVLAEEISRLTQELLVGEKGEELRERAQELKKTVLNSIQPGGSSRRTLDAIINLVKSS